MKDNMILKIGSVTTFKLNSGEELIAKVLEVNDNWVEIETPVSVAPGPQGLGLVPSMFTADADEKVRLNIASVAIYALTDDSVRMKYIEATTGIKVPEKKLILG
jgi:hypothetical protein